MPDTAIVIPVYQEVPPPAEVFSLILGLRILHTHPVVFICPESLDTGYYSRICGEHAVSPDYIRFDDACFTSVASYNRLMLIPEFYRNFMAYEFMLIYQLDALVFSDRLEEWCGKGYDYLGAPLFLDPAGEGAEPVMQKKCCNGGFSLRRVKTTCELLDAAANSSFSDLRYSELRSQRRYVKAFLARLKSRKSVLEVIVERNMQEDIALAHYLPRFFPHYTVADAEVAMHFSFEEYPQRLYCQTGRSLPFGCHAFQKYDFGFWRERLKELGLWDEALLGGV